MTAFSGRWWLMAVLALLPATNAAAQWCTPQECPDLWFRVQAHDTNMVCRLVEGDTVPADRFSAAFTLLMTEDSVGIVDYTFSECRRNGELLQIPTWRLDRRVNASQAMIAANSRTAAFPLVPGDTLSFYRELNWYTAIGYHNELDNYYSSDTLDYSVELVRVADSSRIVLLDSLGALPSLQPSIPRLYGMRPMAALVSYAVPSSVLRSTSDSAFIRLVPHARGDGAYYFTRWDDITVRISERLNQPFYQALNDYIGQRGAATKIGIEELQRLDESSATAGDLKVLAVAGSSDQVTIAFRAPADHGKVGIVIVDALGQVVFYPYTGPASTDERIVAYRFPRGGIYFVGLSVDGNLVQTRKVIITN